MMKRIDRVLVGALLAGGLQAMQPCGVMAQETTTLRLAGSNTIGDKLAAELAKQFATQSGFAASVVISTPAPEEYEIQSTRAEDGRMLRTRVEAHGTGSGAKRLLKGEADFWMASRQARQSDLDDARKDGATRVPALPEMLAYGAENVIAQDALLIIVSPRNPVKSLTLAQLKDIFSGRIRNWSQVGGSDLPIAVYSRDEKSGTFDTLCTLLSISECAKVLPSVAKRLYESSEDLSDEVAAGSGNIGFVGFAYQRSARVVPIESVCGSTALPTSFAVKAEEYPLSRRLFLYRYDTQTAIAKSFLDFVLSDAAQPVIKSVDFIDFRTETASTDYSGDRLDKSGDAQDGQRTAIRQADRRAFEAAVRGATRLSITFRYQAGSSTLDSRAEEDLKRLVATMRTPQYASHEAVLIGFTQSQGDYESNRTLSERRAIAVRDRLRDQFSFNAVARPVGVGPTSPVACNLEPTGRFLNQRVEVWVRPAEK